MDWTDKRVAVISRNPSLRWMQEKLKQSGAILEDSMSDFTDIVIVPMLKTVEKELAEKDVDLIPYPEVILEFIDDSFSPAWISAYTIKPAAYTTIIIPDYTRSKLYMEDESDLDYTTMLDIADDMGIPVNGNPDKGTVLVLLPNNIHQHNLDYVKEYLQKRVTHNNIAFITMKHLSITYREWCLAGKINKRSQNPTEQQRIVNQYFDAKWKTTKELVNNPIKRFAENEPPRDYVTLDTEYRNWDAATTYPAVTEIGIVKVVNGIAVDHLNIMVEHDGIRTRAHHKYRFNTLQNFNYITNINEAIKLVKDFINDLPIIGHQIKTDMLGLCFNGNCTFDNLTYDTRWLVVNELSEDLGVGSLPRIADKLQLHKNSHWALDDAITTQQLYEYIVENRSV